MFASKFRLGMTISSPALFSLLLSCNPTPVVSTCDVIKHNLTQHPHHSIQDSDNFKNDTTDDDFIDLDESLSHVPAEYELTLEFGGPGGAKINAVADTGSSNLIVQGAGCSGCKGTAYKPGPNAISSGQTFPVFYGSGNGSVAEYRDLVGLVCSDGFPYTFGVMSQSNNLPNILGLAYASIAQPSAEPLPTFFDLLVKDHHIADLFSMTLCGTRSGSQIILGDNNHLVDQTELNFAPILEESYYVLPFKSMRVKGATTSLGIFPDYRTTKTRTILDSGTTLNLVPRQIFEAIVVAMNKVNNSKGLGIPSMFFKTENPAQADFTMEIEESAIAQFPILEVEVESVAGPSFWLEIPPQVYFKDLGSNNRIFGFRPSTGNPAFIFGQVLMENNYTVFDRDDKRVGFGPLTGLCKG